MPANPSPVVLSIDPTTGSPSCGTTCTIIGKKFGKGAFVVFGDAKIEAKVESATRITCVSPPGQPRAAVSITVVNGDNSRGTLADAFRYWPFNPKG